MKPIAGRPQCPVPYPDNNSASHLILTNIFTLMLVQWLLWLSLHWIHTQSHTVGNVVLRDKGKSQHKDVQQSTLREQCPSPVEIARIKTIEKKRVKRKRKETLTAENRTAWSRRWWNMQDRCQKKKTGKSKLG